MLHAWKWAEQNKGSFGQQKCTLPSVTIFFNKFLQAKFSLENLEAKIEELKEVRESSKHEEWTEKIARVETAKKTLDTNMQTLLEQKFVDNLKLRLSKINRHKKWRKKHIKKLQMVRDERQRRRETLHKTIDEWRTEWIAKELALKREQARRREAEKRVQEAEANRSKHRELSKLLEKVKKLRDLRRDRLKREGHFFPEEDDEFFNKVASLNDVMKIEEARLDQERNAAAEHKRNEAMDVVMKEREKERDPVYEYWHQAEFDIDNLISIRRQWDAFLVAPSTTGSSCIPPSFVDPSPPANYVWASCLTHGSN
ncbi:u11/u12 small nuclear ribonucleoprotein 59 kda protein [Gigaspora margarita]|uniref:U11/u12 small nuclear ribonucleoprotein 59 kDa protein n=1 Tax=Gigaspora margarita TaxID=4874 RepID=A0A8H4AM66_GIGMA|nr:u11/u12 small nuclear ribonucleoprotein 59 kda protein [Gigaspora margarita]